MWKHLRPTWHPISDTIQTIPPPDAVFKDAIALTKSITAVTTITNLEFGERSSKILSYHWYCQTRHSITNSHTSISIDTHHFFDPFNPHQLNDDSSYLT